MNISSHNGLAIVWKGFLKCSVGGIGFVFESKEKVTLPVSTRAPAVAAESSTSQKPLRPQVWKQALHDGIYHRHEVVIADAKKHLQEEGSEIR